jgi:hypothetical protein
LIAIVPISFILWKCPHPIEEIAPFTPKDLYNEKISKIAYVRIVAA